MDATLDEAAPGNSTLSTAPDNPHLSVASTAPSSSVQEFSLSSRLPHLDAEGDHLPKPSTKMKSDTPAAPTPSHLGKLATERASKRVRVDKEDDNMLPVSKKAARNGKVNAAAVEVTSPAMVEASIKPSMHISSYDVAENEESSAEREPPAVAVSSEAKSNHDQDEPAGSDESTEKSKMKPEVLPKRPIATSNRCRACNICKRRKVKCKHNRGQEEAGNDPTIQEETDLKSSTVKTKRATKPMQADREGQSVNLETSALKTEAQGLIQVDGTDKDDAEAEEESPKALKAKKKAAPKKVAAPPERTSARNRKAPERFEDVGEHAFTKVRPKKSTSKVFDPTYVTTNSTSRLGKADVYHMLLEDAAWTTLSAEQQAILVSMLPDTTENQQLAARIKAGETGNTRPQAFTMSNDCFRTDVAKFKEDLMNGHLAKTWQAAAEQAVVERAAGEYDAWKAEEAELWWGQKSK